MDDPRLPLEHPANAGVLAWFRSRDHLWGDLATDPRLASCNPAELTGEQIWLGTHPDVLSQLRGPVAAKLPEDCHWVLRGRAVLAHPHTGVVFGWAGGMDYALRLPRESLEAALRSGAKQVKHVQPSKFTDRPAWTLDLREIGPDWCFGRYRADEADWCLAAFEHAARGWPTGG